MRAGSGRVYRAFSYLGVALAFALMPRTYLIFGDIEGKLDVLRVECTKCDRRGMYYVHRLIKKYGRKANMTKLREQLNGDCPKRDRPACWNAAI